ncbi:MAG: N-acetylmuramoyl-L-alanine amidase family protein [Candidatus Dormibacteraceae bacterium]
MPFLALVAIVAGVIVTSSWLGSRTPSGQHGGHPPAARVPTPTGLGTSAPLNLQGAAAGACVAYAPTHGNLHKTVFIDPGHGGPDPGTSGATSNGTNLQEKTETLKVALTMLPLLRGAGYRVVLSRTTDSTVTALGASDVNQSALTTDAEIRDLNARVACANLAQASVLLSIHFNGFDDPSVGGTQTFYDDARPFTAADQALAGDIQSAVVKSLGLNDRGIVSDAQDQAETLTGRGAAYGHFIVLGPTDPGLVPTASAMPGALCEVGFLTDPSDAAVIRSHPERVASGLVSGLESFLGHP